MADSTVRVRFLGDSSGAVRSTKQLEGSMGGLSRAAGLATKALAIGVVGGLALAVKAAISFDKSMRNVNSIAKLSEGQFKSLSKSVLAMAKDTAQAPKTLADGLYDIVSSGFKAKDALVVLRASAKAATAGMTDTATASKAVVSVLNAYHLSATEAGKVSDVLFQTVSKGVLTFEELASQIGDVLPIAAQLGVPLEDVGGALATITLRGVSAAEAATQLKQVYVSILKPSKDLAATIKDMGFSSGETAIKTLGLAGFMSRLTVEAKGSGAAFADWFPNVRAMNGALGITGKNIKSLRENINAMKDSQGAASAAFDEQSKSIAVQWQRVKASLTAAAIPIGQALFPVLEKAINKVGEFAIKLEGATPRIKEGFSSLAGGISSVLAPLTQVAQTDLGRSGLMTVIAGGVAARGIISLRGALAGLSVGLGALGPGGLAAAAGIGILTTALISSDGASNNMERALNRVRSALNSLAGAAAAERDTWRTQIALKRQISTLNLEIEGGEKLLARSIKETGKDSLQTRTIENSLKTGRTALKQATQDLTTVTGEHTDAVARHRQKAAEANQTNRDQIALFKEMFAEEVRGQREGKALYGVMGLLDRGISVLTGDIGGARSVMNQYANLMASITRSMGGTGAQARNVRAAVRALTVELGRLPTRKEINIYVNTRYTTTGRPARESGGVSPGKGKPKAAGGVIPGIGVGDTVPALLTPGEVVLNRSQQTRLAQRLGLPDSPHAIFGAVQSFAFGGVAKRGPGKKKIGSLPRSQRPFRESGGPFNSFVASVSQIMAPVNDIRQLIDDKQRQYQQKDREFSQSEEEYLTTITDPETGEQYEVLNPTGINARVAELRKLLELRQEIRDLLEEEGRKLKIAQDELKAAYAKLKAELAAQRRRARLEAQTIADLTATLQAMEKTPPREGSAQRTNDLKQLIAYHKAELADANKIIERDQAMLPAYPSALSAVVGYRRNLPMDREDARLDQIDVQKELDALLGLTAPARQGDFAGGGGDGGGGGDAGGGGGDAATGMTDKERELLGIIGQLRLALGIEASQLGVLGFAPEGVAASPIGHGRRHGPAGFRDGGFVGGPHGSPKLILAHAGEMVLNRAQQMRLGGPTAVARRAGLAQFALGGIVPPVRLDGEGGGTSGSINVQPAQVHISFDNGMDWLRDFVRVETVRNTDAISARQGQRASERRRAGRF